MSKGSFFRNAFWLISGLLIISACSNRAPETPAVEAATSTTPGPEVTILAFGDSLTEGLGVDPSENYPSQLQKKLQSDGYNAQVINGGISGETTTSALARVDWMLNTHPNIVIVETGANDALRGVDIAVTQENIDKIVGQFTDSGTVVIVAGLQIIQNLGQDYTTAFADIYPTVAKKYNSILIPFVLEGVATDPELNQADYIHPNAKGYTVMVDHIYPFVIEAMDALSAR